MKFLLPLLLTISLQAAAQSNYLNARAPLRQSPYIQLPLGAIKPQGWLKEMLIRQKNGSTGNLDILYPLVMGSRNGWLGGDGDQWERGPYWLDGLLPLAYILNDQQLIAKTKPWIEWAIKSQQPDGYFGPVKDLPYEPGIQRDNTHDWWPKMVMLKVLQQYYTATSDERVLKLMTGYFKYQLNELPKTPLDHWTFWAKYRAGDNLEVVYWLYNITGDKFLLQLGDLLHSQTFDYTNAFLNTSLMHEDGSIHGVNLAEGMKEPLIYYMAHPERKYPEALKKGFADLQTFNGMPNGMFGGDESLHGNNPTQGSEFCTAVEMMFTLENSLQITGDVSYADHLEKIAFNALPAQASDDFNTRQYFQQANQVLLDRQLRNFDVNHNGTDLCYGLLTGYACCTSNMHQGWPKFTQNLWYATPDNGIAALIYAPCRVNAKVGNSINASINEETSYPFDETVKFTYSTAETGKAAAFPFYLRIPTWCKQASISINGKLWQTDSGNKVVKISRTWKTGDVVTLQLPMHLYTNTWYENAVSIERGPITYALKIQEQETKVHNTKDTLDYGNTYYEVRPGSPWNYGLVEAGNDKLNENFTIEKTNATGNYPWNLASAPIIIKTKARRIPSWQLYNGMAGPMPYTHIYGIEASKQQEQIILVPYGCTQLRISEFPVVGK